MSLVSQYSGMTGDALHGIIHHESKDDVRKYLQRGISLSTFNIEGIEHMEDADRRQTIHQQFMITGEGIYNTSGRRLFLEPLIIDRGGYSLDLDSARKVDFVFSDAYVEDQTLIYELPAGYTLEYAPADLSFNSPMGDYQAAITMEGNKLTYHRSYQHKPARLPASRIGEVEDFFNKVYKADRVKVVLVKNE